MEEKKQAGEGKSPAKGADVSDKESGVLLLVRKRLSYVPKEKSELEMLEVGHWLTKPVFTPNEALEVLKAFGMPKTAQIAVDGRAVTTEVTIKKRHLKARNKVKKDRHEELTAPITGAKAFIKYLKQYEMLGDQVEAVASKEEALTLIEGFKRRIAPKEKK